MKEKTSKTFVKDIKNSSIKIYVLYNSVFAVTAIKIFMISELFFPHPPI